MSEPTPTETGAGTATDPDAQIQPAAFASLKLPRIKASAKEMAEFLDSYADQLRRVAEQLRTKEASATITLPWPPHGPVIFCNGGGDGGGGGGG